MKGSVPPRKQAIRLGLLSSFGCLTILGSLWFAGRLRVEEQLTLPVGAVLRLRAHPHGPNFVTVPAGACVLRFSSSGDDIFYDSHSHLGYGYGTHQFDALRQQGTQYHWRLELDNHTLVGS